MLHFGVSLELVVASVCVVVLSCALHYKLSTTREGVGGEARVPMNFYVLQCPVDDFIPSCQFCLDCL